MAVRPIDGNELIKSLKNRRLHILAENENDSAAVFDDIIDWIKYSPTLTPSNEPLTCDGCVYLEQDSAPCAYCTRMKREVDYYRPPEGENYAKSDQNNA